MADSPGLFTLQGAFDPLSITGCVLWLKSTSLALSDGDPVATWTDSSGNGNDCAQGTAGNKPLYKVNIINSLPSVLFDGTDDFMTGTAGTSLSQPLSVFVVLQPTLSTASQKTYATFIHNIAGARCFLCAKLSTNVWGTFASADVSSGNALTSGTSYLLENTSLTGQLFLYQKGVQVASLADNEVGSGAAMGLGKDLGNAGREYAGYISEVLWYNSILSSGNRILVENYLIAKYAL